MSLPSARNSISLRMDLLIFGYIKRQYTNNYICSDLAKLVLSYYDTTFKWTILGDKLQKFLSKSESCKILESDSFYFNDIQFKCHLIKGNSDKSIGFCWSIINLAERYLGIKIIYRLECKETQTFWQYRSNVLNKKMRNYWGKKKAAHGWPFLYTLTLDPPNPQLQNLKLLTFICDIVGVVELKKSEIREARHRQTDDYYLKDRYKYI
eukprot:UN08407